MNRDMICIWLGLADKRWPPDPYALLGLAPAECTGARIEKRVQERMAKLRCYQLSHPEEATEAMNRVAQAFIALVERHGQRPEARAAAVQPPPSTQSAAPAPLASGPSTLNETAVAQQPQLSWQAAPPPVRNARSTALPAIPVGTPAPEAAEPDWPQPAPAAFDEPSAPVETEEQVIRSLAEESEEARAGALTLQAVIARADQTRLLVIAWREAGRYLASPKRKLTRSSEKSDFTSRLEELLEAAEPYPDFVVSPGRPGYRAVALAHLGITPEVFNAMGEEQREQLARDWALAYKILLAHRAFLLRQFKALRRRGMFGRATHILRTSLREHPGLWQAFGVAVGITALVLVGILILVPLMM
jgi:hypothetical protein